MPPATAAALAKATLTSANPGLWGGAGSEQPGPGPARMESGSQALSNLAGETATRSLASTDLARTGLEEGAG